MEDVSLSPAPGPSTLRGVRDHVPDLLTRPPCGTREFVGGWAHLLVDPVRQLAVLAELFEGGLLSWDEFERYRRGVAGL